MRPPCWLLLALFSTPGWAESPLHTRSTLSACGARRTQDGPCFTVTPDQRWERISADHGLVLLRRVPPSPGEPPLFFRPQDLTATDPAPAGPHSPRGQVTADDRILIVLLLAVMALPARLLWSLWRRRSVRRRSRRAHARALAVAVAEINAQRTRLQVRRLQLVIPDHYGTREMGKWHREKQHFCNSRILGKLAARGLAGQWPLIAEAVDRRIERAASSPPPEFRPEDPLAYEQLCAMLLRRCGWEAQVTAAGGDQGTDILARRGRRSLVLQCKLYGRPVGNSAVQQIAAARAHHRADFAAVVSNADFTARARELAATNDVYLLHHEELRDFMPARMTRRG